LTSTTPAIIIVVADVSFWSCPLAAAPKELTGRDQWGYVDVYSIYKETRASGDPGTHERHYAGWTADRDIAVRRANEIYEGRDTIEAALVISNGPMGIEVVYRIGDEN
jgi:hypothetical protein